MNVELVFSHSPWQEVQHKGIEWATRARHQGASALRVWADGHLAAYWIYGPTLTPTRLEEGRKRWSTAQKLVFEGLRLEPGQPYWLEGAGLEVCWRAEITQVASPRPEIDQDPLLVGC